MTDKRRHRTSSVLTTATSDKARSRTGCRARSNAIRCSAAGSMTSMTTCRCSYRARKRGAPLDQRLARQRPHRQRKRLSRATLRWNRPSCGCCSIPARSTLTARARLPVGAVGSGASQPWTMQRLPVYMGFREATSDTEVDEVVVGIEGRFGDTDWTWEAYHQNGNTDSHDPHEQLHLGRTLAKTFARSAELRPRGARSLSRQPTIPSPARIPARAVSQSSSRGPGRRKATSITRTASSSPTTVGRRSTRRCCSAARSSSA